MKLLVTGGSGFIGTNLVEHFLSKGIELLNVDWNPPMEPSQRPYWEECDILDREKLIGVFQAFQPTHVLHLAARADTNEEENVDLYLQNTVGTQNVLDAVKSVSTIERFIATSTQFVCIAGYKPQHDQDYEPFTLYGKTKIVTEQLTRKADLDCAWTIIRPTTIWGPWSLRYRDVMFKVMKQGIYFHVSKRNVVRSYGYVKNVVWQIEQMLTVDREIVDQQVFYVGDKAFDLRVWVESISKELTGKNVRILPTWFVAMIAKFGDICKAVGVKFPITTTRFNSMTTDYVTFVDKTIETFGPAPYDMEAGIKEMIQWYNERSQGVPHPAKVIPELNDYQPVQEKYDNLAVPV
ncbi:MAG: NAD(P)-dependent oxidoreductase [Bacteroidota bacterium]